MSRLSLNGVSTDRQAIFAGGPAALTGIFDSLEREAERLAGAGQTLELVAGKTG